MLLRASGLHALVQVTIAGLTPEISWVSLLDNGLAIAVVSYISWMLANKTIPRITQEFREDLRRMETLHQEEKKYYRELVERLMRKNDGK